MLISLGLFEEGTVLTREMEKKYTDFMLQHLGPYGFSKCQASSVSGTGMQGYCHKLKYFLHI